MAGSEGRFLADELRAARKSRLDRLGVVADDDRHGIRSGYGAQSVLEQRRALRQVKDLGPRALEARPLAGGEQHRLDAAAGEAHEACGVTSAAKSSSSRIGSKSESLRACARFAGLTPIADLSALTAMGVSPARAAEAARQ